jgi:hypothetical protein
MIEYDKVARAHARTAADLPCTSDDPNDHQGDTCPVHEGEDEDEPELVTPEDIVRENRNDDMAAWLGVKRR